MRHIGILCLLFALIRLVDQQVEPIGFSVPRQNARELLFVQLHQFLHRVPERFEKLPCDIAIRLRTGRDAKNLRGALR